MSNTSPLKNRMRSFNFAFAGLWTLLKTQPNARIHACATIAVIAAGLHLKISAPEWSLLILAIVAVWLAEALNTALEFLADVASPQHHPLIKNAKDVAAAGVLITATGAIAIGALILAPHLLN